jgi:hypothetical protein
MFSLATLATLPDIWALMTEYQHCYVDDYETLTVDWVIDLIIQQQMWVVYSIKKYKTIIAIFWWTDRIPTVQATLHCLIDPSNFRGFYKEYPIWRFLLTIAQQAGVNTLQAFPMAHQTCAIKLLGYFFKLKNSNYSQTKYQGVVTTVQQWEWTSD